MCSTLGLRFPIKVHLSRRLTGNDPKWVRLDRLSLDEAEVLADIIPKLIAQAKAVREASRQANLPFLEDSEDPDISF